MKAILHNIVVPIGCIAVGVYLALIGATASWPWIEGIIMGVAP